MSSCDINSLDMFVSPLDHLDCLKFEMFLDLAISKNPISRNSPRLRPYNVAECGSRRNFENFGLFERGGHFLLDIHHFYIFLHILHRSTSFTFRL